MRLHRPAHDREPETADSGALRPAAVVAIEEPLALLLRDRRSAVRDPEKDGTVLFARPIAFVYRAGARAAGAAPGRRIVDLCTGTGEFALRCGRRGATVTAVDFTPARLERARRKARGAPVRLVEADVRRLPFADSSFDVAVLSFALHDMPEPARTEALREATRVAREGVVVLDYAPPRSGPLRALVLAALGSFEAAYLRGFARTGGVAQASRRAGLEIERTRRPLPGWFGLWRARRGGSAPTAQGRTRRISASSVPGSSSASS